MVKLLVMSLVHLLTNMIPFLPVYFCLIDIALSQGSMVWVGGLEGERGSGEADQGEHNLALPRIVQSGPEHLNILKINLGFVSLLDYEGGLLDRILWKMVQQRSFCASKIIRLMFVIVFISFSIYCTNQIVGKNIGIFAQQWCVKAVCWFFAIYCDSDVKLG